MKKADFVARVSEKSGLSKKDSQLVIKAFTDAVTELLTAHDKLILPGFGTFSTASRAARTARVPGTGKTVEVAATTIAKFKPGKALKDNVSTDK